MTSLTCPSWRNSNYFYSKLDAFVFQKRTQLIKRPRIRTSTFCFVSWLLISSLLMWALASSGWFSFVVVPGNMAAGWLSSPTRCSSRSRRSSGSRRDCSMLLSSRPSSSFPKAGCATSMASLTAWRRTRLWWPRRLNVGGGSSSESRQAPLSSWSLFRWAFACILGTKSGVLSFHE